MAIVIILIGTVLLVVMLIGCLTWLLVLEEKPHLKHNEVSTLYPAFRGVPVPDRETVPYSSVEAKPTVQPQPFIPQLVPMQAEESLKSVCVM